MNLTKQEILEMLYAKAINEIEIKKKVNRKGIVTKVKSAGQKGKKVVDGKVKTVTSDEKRNKKLGNLKRKKTLKTKSASLKKKSTNFAVAGRAKRKKLGVK